MSMPPKTSPESTAEDTVFTKDVLTCEAWTEQLLVELKSKGGRAQAMKSLLENSHVSQTDIFKKTTGSQHEYLVVEVSTPDEVTRTLRFEQRDRDTRAEDPSLQDVVNDPDGGKINFCYRGIQQCFITAWCGISRVTSISGTPAVDCVWSEPMHQRYGIIVRSVRYRGNQGPSLLDLVAAFGTISNHAPTYAIATCHHCMWLADSLSSLLENSSEHDVRLSSDVQGRWRCVQMHRRNEKDVQDMVGEMIRRKGIMMV
jgi:hypothetical protein